MFFIVAVDAAEKIQNTFQNHQTRLRLKNRATWKIYEKLESSNEKTEEKVTTIKISSYNYMIT